MNFNKKYLAILTGFSFIVFNAAIAQQTNTNTNKFKQLKEELPTPNIYRTASGAPGHKYYQQLADYKIKMELDDEKQKLYGVETITYHNNSPDELTYLWIQLDQNMRAKDSDTKKTTTNKISDKMSFKQMRSLESDFDGGFKIDYVKDASGKSLPYVVNQTMMRVDLPKKLMPKDKYSFSIKWWYNVNNRKTEGGRSGYEYFEENDNYLYTIAQFFPRMAVYNEVEGWQNKQFLGRGEFALPFGNYEVNITVPSDHIVGSTGTLQNSNSVLTSVQRERFKKAQSSFDKPVLITTEDEMRKAEKTRKKGQKTWIYKAENVRDFAFVSSRKFIWDAMAVKMGSKTVMAMSYYPKEGNPLWEKYSTKAVAHTLNVYSRHSFDYPYPVAISVHTDRIGMEYPMICFNGGRPEKDGTYSKRTKYGMISVIIHEVGHNYFPMIVNSDERQWTWMDEGLNSFLQLLAEQEWERNYPSRRGPVYKIVDYMKGDKSSITPIMTNSESIFQFGNNAYGKPATALNILRETVMGRELFDFAFKEYCQRWMFKHPTPADFFRTMEDASAVDLDWFWRGWFYTTDHVDIALDGVKWYKVDTKDPKVEKPLADAKKKPEDTYITYARNKESINKTYSETDPSLIDFYNEYNPFEVTILDKDDYDSYLSDLSEEDKGLVGSNKNFYELSFSNVGGLVMPLILEFNMEDGTTEIRRIPAEIWKFRDEISKIFVFNKEVLSIQMDPFLETADVDVSNNSWPKFNQPSRFELYKKKRPDSENLMQKSKKALKRSAESEDDE